LLLKKPFAPSAEKFADVNARLDRAIEQVSPGSRGRITIHKTYTADPRIQCYPEKLGRVFLHLLSNAIKAIHAKGNIWIETARNNDTLSVRIRDDGVGIPKDNLEKIFDPFFRFICAPLQAAACRCCQKI